MLEHRTFCSQQRWKGMYREVIFIIFTQTCQMNRSFLEECVFTCIKLLVSNNKVCLRFTDSWIQHRNDSNYGKYFTSNWAVKYCILMDTYRHMWGFYSTFHLFNQRGWYWYCNFILPYSCTKLIVDTLILEQFSFSQVLLVHINAMGLGKK